MTTLTLSRQERRHLERTRAKAFRRQRYLQQLAETDPAQFQPGTITIAHIAHDDWCPKLNGGLCRCEPSIAFETVYGAQERESA